MKPIDVDIDSLMSELHQLSKYSSCEEPPPAVTRLVFSDEDIAARKYFINLCEAADLQVSVDAIGNIFGRWTGSDPEQSAVATGSHIDAIPNAGMYDGTVGVLGGLEAIRALKRVGFQPTRSIDVVMITSEEPTRFGVGCLGSRALSKNLNANDLQRLVDDDGIDLNTARKHAGIPGDLDTVAISKDQLSAWVELHIEQGPELEAGLIDIGIVTAIAAPATFTVTVTGAGGHAGGVLMPARRDALMAASELMVQIELIAKQSQSGDLVATVGTLSVHPGAVNSIPSQATFTIDIRDIDPSSRDDAMRQIKESAEQIESRREVGIQFQTVNSDPPAICDPNIVSLIQTSCFEHDCSQQKMVSRAYHDSLFMSQVAPIGMIFIPCRDGVSHRPDEFSSPDQIAKGVRILAATLRQLAT